MRSRARVAVVGGGISGVAAAYALHARGHDVELVERGEQLGGRCAPGLLGDRPVTFGGKNVGRRYARFRAFTAALGDHPYEPFGINSSRVDRGRIVTIDSSRRYRSLRTLARLGSPRDLVRLVRLAARIRADEENRYLGSAYFAGLAQRSDSAPLSAYFGVALTRSLLRPVAVRMNGAEPDEVHLGTFGTNLGMLMDSFDQLSSGIAPVLRAFAARVPVRLSAEVTGLVVRDGVVTGLRLDGDEELDCDAVLLAVPAHSAAELVHSSHPGLAERLRGVRYFPGAVVLAEYDRPIFTPEVRALVFDQGPCSNAGAYGIEERQTVRYTFSGRGARPLLRERASVEDLLAAGESQLAAHVPFDGARLRRADSRQWAAAYCAYVPFHGEFLAGVRRATLGAPGLELAGDYMRGASMEACFRSGEEAAARLSEKLPTRMPPAKREPAGRAPVFDGR
jgi:oxygen-dependent protoporphyrinogen oxidase